MRGDFAREMQNLKMKHDQGSTETHHHNQSGTPTSGNGDGCIGIFVALVLMLLGCYMAISIVVNHERRVCILEDKAGIQQESHPWYEFHFDCTAYLKKAEK